MLSSDITIKNLVKCVKGLSSLARCERAQTQAINSFKRSHKCWNHTTVPTYCHSNKQAVVSRNNKVVFIGEAVKVT